MTQLSRLSEILFVELRSVINSTIGRCKALATERNDNIFKRGIKSTR